MYFYYDRVTLDKSFTLDKREKKCILAHECNFKNCIFAT